MFRSEGSDVRIVAFRVASGESVLSIHHGPMATFVVVTNPSNDTITCLPEALANVGQDDDQHIDVP